MIPSRIISDSALFTFAAVLLSSCITPSVASDKVKLFGKDLPKDFIYGCGLTAYQVEGAWNEDGKGPSIWDTFSHAKGKGHVANDATGDVAMDFYHTYAQDIPLFKDALGINNFDFTVAWTRILPKGRGKNVNEKGVEYYKRIAEQSHKLNMTTTCTLYHWDLPQTLQDEYGGWASKKIVDDFQSYAHHTMKSLGHSCDRWVSMNEPRTFCVEGYGGGEGESAPGIAHNWGKMYKCMHHALLSHAHAYKVFKKLKAEGVVKGTFGIKIDGGPAKPLDPTSERDMHAVKRSNAFEMGWPIAPLTTGEYPAPLRSTVGKLLPKFSAKESALVKDSYDIVYYDGYTSQYAGALPKDDDCKTNKKSDYWPVCVNQTQTDLKGDPIGKPTGSDWNYLVNDTLLAGLTYMHERWGVKALAIGETGTVLPNPTKLSFEQKIDDDFRVEWYKTALDNVQLTLQKNIPLVGFVPWSCIRNFEWSNGYVGDFGLIYAQHGKNKKRTPKKSAGYLKDAFRP